VQRSRCRLQTNMRSVLCESCKAIANLTLTHSTASICPNECHTGPTPQRSPGYPSIRSTSCSIYRLGRMSPSYLSTKPQTGPQIPDVLGHVRFCHGKKRHHGSQNRMGNPSQQRKCSARCQHLCFSWRRCHLYRCSASFAACVSGPSAETRLEALA
jgi:hypothetical protein